MGKDVKTRNLLDFFQDLSSAKKQEALDFVKWLWVSKESKFLEQKKKPGWVKKLYLLFGETRKQSSKFSAKKIDSDLKRAITEVRKEHA
ncbi:MAG: hypothetical protein WC632_01145 [Candidatus Margulisiibacteriota bacterium]